MFFQLANSTGRYKLQIQSYFNHCYRPPTKLGKQCFQSCLSIHRHMRPYNHCPWLDHTVEHPPPHPDMELHCKGPPSPAPVHSTLRTGTPPLLVTSSSHHWRPLETCSLHNPYADLWWLLKHVRSAQARSMHSAGMLSCSILFSTEETDTKSDLELQ